MAEAAGAQRAAAVVRELDLQRPAAGAMPGVEISEMGDLLEVHTMLADRVVEWTREWERGGREKGRRDALSEVRAVLIELIEERFGPLSENTRQRLEAVDSFRVLTEMVSRVSLARSLDDLGLG